MSTVVLGRAHCDLTRDPQLKFEADNKSVAGFEYEENGNATLVAWAGVGTGLNRSALELYTIHVFIFIGRYLNIE